MTKAILKHVANQYILIVEGKPKQTQWYLDDAGKIRINYINDYDYWVNRPNYKCIIAAENLDGVKGIRFRIDRVSLFTSDVSYKNILNNLIDTEVEVTEEEDYYLIRL